MNTQINNIQTTQPKSCEIAISSNLILSESGLVVDSVNGYYARISYSIWLGYLTFDFLPNEKWIRDEWTDEDIISVDVKMHDSNDDRELQDLLRDSEDILHGHLTGKGPYGKEVFHAA